MEIIGLLASVVSALAAVASAWISWQQHLRTEEDRNTQNNSERQQSERQYLPVRRSSISASRRFFVTWLIAGLSTTIYLLLNLFLGNYILTLMQVIIMVFTIALINSFLIFLLPRNFFILFFTLFIINIFSLFLLAFSLFISFRPDNLFSILFSTLIYSIIISFFVTIKNINLR